MWYFTWILGLGFALLCGLVNLLWLEARWAAGPLGRWAADEDLKES
ncbi:cytochrome bd oxidase small subunit, CydX/CbdX family [Aeromonas salmonicida]